MSSSVRIVSSNGVFGSGRVRPMDEIDIDVISAEVRQALLERGHDPRVTAVAAIGRFRIADADLGDEADIASAGTERAAARRCPCRKPLRYRSS